MEQSSSVLHDVAVQQHQQQQHNVQHNLHSQNHIHLHNHLHDIHPHIFRPFFPDENHFIYNQQDIFTHQDQQPNPPSPQPPPQPSQPSDRPLDLSNIDDEPLYVNAKQYFRILKRRVARTRLEEVHRLSRQRKPYLHESRHKHAMRRPRGPGGRFLTADEIAAQKQAAQEDPGPSTTTAPEHDPEDEPDDDDSKPDHSSASPALDSDVFMSHQPPTDPMGMINIAYPPNLPLPSHHLSQPSPQSQANPSSAPAPIPAPTSQTQSRPSSSPVTVYSQQQQVPGPVSAQPQDKGNPVTLTSPYPVQMHHVPHPHAHARHHHPNINAYIYNSDTVGPSPNPEMQRRTEEMIQFGTGSSS